jgi:hypothetical protein
LAPVREACSPARQQTVVLRGQLRWVQTLTTRRPPVANFSVRHSTSTNQAVARTSLALSRLCTSEVFDLKPTSRTRAQFPRTALGLKYKHCESETDDKVDALFGVQPAKHGRIPL